MLINDYHDHKLGVDNPSTKPDRPLVSGAVRPESVKLVLKYGYALHLTLLCLVDTAPMRLWVLANTLLTCAHLASVASHRACSRVRTVCGCTRSPSRHSCRGCM